MGTAIACHAVAEEFLEKGKKCGIDGLVLENPYNNFAEEIVEMGTASKNVLVEEGMKVFQECSVKTIVEVLKIIGIEFNSESWLPEVKCPVMILSAEDDPTIPVRLGRKLLEKTQKSGKMNIEMHEFEGSLGFQHNDIYRAEQLPEMIQQFFNKI